MVRSYFDRWGVQRSHKLNGSWRRQRRHLEALERQKKYDALTIQEKIDKIPYPFPESERQRSRLIVEKQAKESKQKRDSKNV